MSPLVWVTMVIITIVGLVALDQIPLVQDLVTASGYSSGEVFAGIGGIFMVIYVFLAIFEVR